MSDDIANTIPTRLIDYRPFRPSDLPFVVELVSAELSEPYVRSTFHYFLSSTAWPHLCFLALDKHSCPMGVIVCKQEMHRRRRMRGYIAMLSVKKEHRRHGIARHLVQIAIDAMRDAGADEIVLEAEETNTAALALYESLGFMRLKALHRFYFSGQDAIRLLLPLTPLGAETPSNEIATTVGDSQYDALYA